MCFGSEGKASQHTLTFRHLTGFGLLLFCGPHVNCLVFTYSRCGSYVLENSLNFHLDAKLLKHLSWLQIVANYRYITTTLKTKNKKRSMCDVIKNIVTN